MTFALALTQAPQHSYYNGANTATARQYYLRPTQHTPNGPRIAAGTAGMVAGEFRTLWASATDNIFSVQTEDNGSWYNGLDWTPRAAWDAATEQIIVGMRRGNYKVSAYSDVTGDWRELPMPATLGRYLVGTAHYYGMIDEDGSGGVYLGSTDEQRMYRLDPVTESYTQIASHLVSNGHNGAMLAWNADAGALFKYVGDAQRFIRYDPGANAWTLVASSIGNGAHALMEYSPAADRFLIVGGTGTSSRATLVTAAGAKIQVTDAPQPSSMSSGSWIAYHPAGCWLFKGWPETGDQRLYACWPNAAKTDVVWQDIGVAPDNGLTYSTAAVDYDRGMIYIVSTTGLHAYKLPEVTDPYLTLPSGTLTLGTPSVTSSSISLPWTYSASDHDGIEYRYRLTAGTWSAWIDAGLVSPIEITGLTSSAEYEIEARAYNPAGTSTPQTVTVTAGAAGDVVGTLAAQESGADTSAMSGAVLVAGALSATESGADTAIIIGGNILAGYMAAQESGSDTAAASGVVVVSGAMSASEAGADGFAASGSIGAADVIGNFSALESGADSIVVTGVVVVSGSMAAAEAGSDTMQTDNGEWYPSSRTISVPSGRTITLRPR